MKCLGIDPASGISAAALVNGKQELEKTFVWKKTESKSDAWNLHDYYHWLLDVIQNPFGGTIAEMACVEFLKVSRNAQTTRKLSHYQAASVLACKESGLVVIEASASEARKEALGRGDLSKEDAFKQVKKLYPGHKFLRADQGGYDESDATVLGRSGPGLAER